MHSESQLDLRSENLALRRQLETLLREARSNEAKMRRFDDLEQRLIAARGVDELLGLLLRDYRRDFGLEFVTLSLVDAEGECAGLLAAKAAAGPNPAASQPLAHLTGLSLLPDSARLRALYGAAPRPWLGRFDAGRHAGLFDAPPGAIGSVALLPLLRHGALIGSLQVGSTDDERYAASDGTRLLERMVAIFAICLDSALNHERLRQAGLTDMLTGVHNRRYFEHRCQIEIAQARRHRQPLACMFLDIDHFKRINDGHGHPVGDEVLRAVGQLIQGQLRAGDTIARWGGEEFIVLLPRAAAADAREIAERIRASIGTRPLPLASGAALPVTASIGLARLGNYEAGREPAALAPELVAAADRALYRAKQGGRDRVVCDETMDQA